MAREIDDLFLEFKHCGKWMAFTAADMRVKTSAPGFFTKRSHFYPPLETGCKRTGHFAAQLHEFTCVCPVYRRDRAGTTQVAGPGGTKQPAFFMIAAAVIIPIEIFTFRPGRCFHSVISKLPQVLTAGEFQLHPGQVLTGSSVNTNGVSDFDKVRTLHLITCFNFNLLGHTSGSITAHSHFSVNDL